MATADGRHRVQFAIDQFDAIILPKDAGVAHAVVVRDGESAARRTLRGVNRRIDETMCHWNPRRARAARTISIRSYARGGAIAPPPAASAPSTKNPGPAPR